jgi:peptidoglycan/xylan/chitin deacetylase (PgdA/CDA1 family)
VRAGETDEPGGRLAGLVALAAAGVVILAVAGCAAPGPTRTTPSPVPATPVATQTIATTPTPSPEVTATPVTSPVAGDLPVVNSCDPASVPAAVAVTTPANALAGFFRLRVPILMYHRIVPFAESGNSIADLVVPPQTFEAQLSALKTAGWHTVTMATLANDLALHITPPAKTVVITIDDGWDDGYTYAFPILESHGFVATYFVIAGRIDNPDFLSSAHLRALVAAGDEIGDHTMSHANLAKQTAPSTLKFEIDAAAARIAQVTGYWPASLAYPSGTVNDQAAAAVAACGQMRIAVIEGAMQVTTTAPPKPGETQGPPTTVQRQGYETWAERFNTPRIRVTYGTTPATLLELVVYK